MTQIPPATTAPLSSVVPTGGGWYLFQPWKVANRVPSGTHAQVEAIDVPFLSIFGLDIGFGNSVPSQGDLENSLGAEGKYLVAYAIYRNPPAFLGTGLDDYRLVAIWAPLSGA